ncbi:MAG: hypothetical protein OQK04_17220 [Kangiellaceae bacterium]|nr:hypothetical protein [Kangiellaceae bacterium]MCW9000454.1 hypothetical protein [Kangiellaceae bacterium]
MKLEYWSSFKCYVILVASLFVAACGMDAGNVESGESNLAGGDAPEFVVTSVSDYKFMFNDHEVGGIINFASKQLSHCTLAFASRNFVAGYEAKIFQENDKDFDLSCINDKDSFQLDPSDSTSASMKVVDSNKVILDFELVGLNSREKVKKNDVTLKLSEAQLRTLLLNAN